VTITLIKVPKVDDIDRHGTAANGRVGEGNRDDVALALRLQVARSRIVRIAKRVIFRRGSSSNSMLARIAIIGARRRNGWASAAGVAAALR
jgi:hypothetical protein